jgi:transcriptional regulator with XRE-family HTH domain
MKSVKYLSDLQKKTSLNDTELARSLGITQGAVGHYKSGRRIMDDETCLAVANGLNIDPLLVVAAACVDRAEKCGQKSLWEVFMTRTATAASALLFVFVNLFLTAPNAKAAPALGYSPANGADALYYVKLLICKMRKLSAKLAWFKRLLFTATLQPTAS